jgi:hypothetical protein
LSAGFENIFDPARVGAGEPVDAATALGRQKLAFVEKCADIGPAVAERYQLRANDPLDLLARAAPRTGNGNGPFEGSLNAAKAHFFERNLFGQEVVIKARLTNP